MSTPTPTVGSLATARERLETANFRLGKAQMAAIMSSAVARQDAARLAETTLERDEADKAYRALVAKLTTLPGQLAEANAEEVRSRADSEADPMPVSSLGHPAAPPITAAGAARLFGDYGAGSELQRPALGIPTTRILNAQQGDKEIPLADQPERILVVDPIAEATTIQGTGELGVLTHHELDVAPGATVSNGAWTGGTD